MRYERDFLNLQLEEDTVLTLGKFDGLHRGHKLLMDSVFEKKAQGLKAAVFTFDLSPKSVTEGTFSQVITTNEEKKQLFENRGIDYLIECPFTEAVIHMEAETFIEKIVTCMRVKCMVVGTDFHFGYRRRGDYKMLKQYANRYGYEVVVVEKMQHNGRDISSTYIREEIRKGNMELAEYLLSYPYFIQGTIIHGNQLGRTIGFPTINIVPPEQKLLPPFGVYASKVHIDGNVYEGITNIGIKPTVRQNNPAGAETYIYDFKGNIYNKRARVDILKFVRPEQKFQDIEALKKQLQMDIADGRKCLKQYENGVVSEL